MKLDADLFRLLGDEGRLRILRLVDRERLNVSELVSILGIAQSGVSRHLRLLRDAGLVREDRFAGWSFYQTRPEAFSNGLAAAILREIREGDGHPEDAARLQEVLRRRPEGRPAPSGERLVVPGRSWAAWARALGLLLPRLRVADLGCGEGNLSLEIASWARWVVGIDRSPEALKKARIRSRRRGIRNVRWREGELEGVPLMDGAVDLALLAQSLHCAADPSRALAEAFRILAPGGKILILDLKTHSETWVRERLGHLRLGFGTKELKDQLASAGFERVRVRLGDGRRGDPFRVLIADGRKPKESKPPRRPARVHDPETTEEE
ncbi:MAG: metalloregulator ArsR/SmtB family transcription factor [Planctomycetes bacterium]|nr:metalloregulator ArsR/SmtB family transcription factor [Planctomycetota bacterium]